MTNKIEAQRQSRYNGATAAVVEGMEQWLNGYTGKKGIEEVTRSAVRQTLPSYKCRMTPVAWNNGSKTYRVSVTKGSEAYVFTVAE